MAVTDDAARRLVTASQRNERAIAAPNPNVSIGAAEPEPDMIPMMARKKNAAVPAENRASALVRT